MLDYQQRVLDENKAKLSNYMHSDLFSGLDSVNQGLLMVQLVAMNNYSDALLRRIELF